MAKCKKCSLPLPDKAVACPACETKLLDKKGRPRPAHRGFNKYGIDRNIPDATALKVRQDCGFGCVMCACMIVIYDHCDPEFKDLKTDHDPDGIALLCPNCNSGTLGKSPRLTHAKVRERRKSPEALTKKQIDHPQFFHAPGPKTFRFGDVSLQGTELNIFVDGDPFLSIKQPKLKGEPVLVHFCAHSSNGAKLLELKDNVLLAWPPSGFDSELTANSIRFSKYKKDLLYLDRSDDETMHIVYAESTVRGYHVEIKDSGIYVNGKLKFGGGELYVEATGEIRIDLARMFDFVVKNP